MSTNPVMINIFERLQSFVDLSNSSNSNNDKLAVIEQFKDDVEVMQILKWTYDPFKQFYVTSSNCKKRSDLVSKVTHSHVLHLLEDLSDRVLTGHTAIGYVNAFVNEYLQYEDLIWSIIDRNLKTRSTTQMINKVVPDLIPTFSVALANAYDEKTAKKVKWEDVWYCSRKLDGVRCIAIVDRGGNTKFYSRAGNEFTTLGKIAEEIKNHPLLWNRVLDGEVCMVDQNGNEDFQGVIKEIKRKDHTIQTPKYFVFDSLTHQEFASGTSERTFWMRDAEMIDTFGDIESPLIDHLAQIEIMDDEGFESMNDIAKANGWEGLMLRKNATYQGKRSSDILKVKTFYDAEYIVTGVENKVHRVIVNGQEVEEEVLSHVYITHKGCTVKVGSGFSLEERRQYYANPDQIVGKTITVQYFEETQNQHGEFSLRFPVIKAVYEGARTF